MKKRKLNRSCQSRSAMLLHASDAAEGKLHEILMIMSDDEVTNIVRSDHLILSFGEKLLKVGKEQHKSKDAGIAKIGTKDQRNGKLFL